MAYPIADISLTAQYVLGPLLSSRRMLASSHLSSQLEILLFPSNNQEEEKKKLSLGEVNLPKVKSK